MRFEVESFAHISGPDATHVEIKWNGGTYAVLPPSHFLPLGKSMYTKGDSKAFRSETMIIFCRRAVCSTECSTGKLKIAGTTSAELEAAFAMIPIAN